jgi:hypothetical protein
MKTQNLLAQLVKCATSVTKVTTSTKDPVRLSMVHGRRHVL